MRKSPDKRLLIILVLLLVIAPFQSAMSGFEDLPDHSTTSSMMTDVDHPELSSHGCNTDDCCNTANCTTASCSFCSVVPALIPVFSFALSNVSGVHERQSDTTPLHWKTSPPFRPPCS